MKARPSNPLTALVVFLLAAILCPHSAQAQGLQSAWETDFGPLHLDLDRNYNISGSYPKYQGWVVGRLLSDGRINAYWMQSAGKRKCPRKVYGTPYWGVVRWRLASNGSMSGEWSYCDDTMKSGGKWSARLTAGTSPLAKLSRGAPPPRRQVPKKAGLDDFMRDADKLFNFLEKL